MLIIGRFVCFLENFISLKRFQLTKLSVSCVDFCIFVIYDENFGYVSKHIHRLSMIADPFFSPNIFIEHKNKNWAFCLTFYLNEICCGGESLRSFEDRPKKVEHKKSQERKPKPGSNFECEKKESNIIFVVEF